MSTQIAPSVPAEAPVRVRGRLHLVSRGIGQTLITLGLMVLLFVVYEVWITNIFAARNNRHNIAQLKQTWQRGTDPLLPLPGEKDPSVPVGDGIGILYIPRLGDDYHEAIVQGDAVPNDDQLEQGAAHYRSTALPGQVGNFALAGHRVGKGEPFLNIDQLRSGDAVIVETRSWWYVYRVKGPKAGSDPRNAQDADGVPGSEVVDATDGDVLLPYPDHPGRAPRERLLVMTTCHPKFTAAHRLIVYSRYETRIASSGVAMPNGIKALYDDGAS